MILLILTYLAGALTILSPCILPVLPFVFSGTRGSFWRNGFPLLLGMVFTFSLFSGVAILGGEWVAQASEVGRILAMILMAFFGLSLIFPSVSERILAPLVEWGVRMGRGANREHLGGSFLIGVSTGLLWAPCAGPILGLVLTGAASQKNIGLSVALLFSYSLGAATSLALALMAGQRFFKTLKGFLGVDQVIKKALGGMVLLGVIAIAFNLDRTILTQVSKLGTDSIEHRLLDWGGVDTDQRQEEVRADEGPLPEFNGISSWLNSSPLDVQSLSGKVVLIDFWTYSCINCLRTLPYVKSWYEKYKDKGLVIIGIHTPEFAFEKNILNVKKAVADLGVSYPVAIDNEYILWNAFKNRYWPAHYFVDRKGRIRHHHFGEGSYEESEEMIKQLLGEDGSFKEETQSGYHQEVIQKSVISVNQIKSPETYVGYERTNHFASTPAMKENQTIFYKAPQKLDLNHWALDGKWLVEGERSVLKSSSGRIFFRFQARDLHLVLGGEKEGVAFKVKVDGRAPEKNHGADIDETGRGLIKEHRLYQLLRLQEPYPQEHTFEIEFLAPEIEAYAFTFG